MGPDHILFTKNKTMRSDFCKLFDAAAMPTYIPSE